MAASELTARVAVAVVGIPLALVVIFLGGWPFGLLIALFAGIGAHEFYDFARAGGSRPFEVIGVASAVLLVLTATRVPTLEGLAMGGLFIAVGLTLVSLGLVIWRRWPDGNPISAVSVTTAGALYTGATLSFALLLRHLPAPDGSAATARDGAALVFFPILVTWVGDSSAYFAGKAWGVRKLIPHVSPGKTVVGAIAALAASISVAVLYGQVVFAGGQPRPGINPLTLGLMGLALSVVAQIGDLSASTLKREAGFKDSGKVFPGHGGVLDRFDALFFTIPLAYLMVRVADILG
jgi:phosphatidate cytidylyltransferase